MRHRGDPGPTKEASHIKGASHPLRVHISLSSNPSLAPRNCITQRSDRTPIRQPPRTMPAIRTSASQSTKRTQRLAERIAASPNQTQASRTHLLNLRPSDEEFERYDDDISIAIPSVARPAAFLSRDPTSRASLPPAPPVVPPSDQPESSSGTTLVASQLNSSGADAVARE